MNVRVFLFNIELYYIIINIKPLFIYKIKGIPYIQDMPFNHIVRVYLLK